MAEKTPREIADEKFVEQAGAALAAVLGDDEPGARQLIAAMYPSRKRELADAAERLAELVEEEPQALTVEDVRGDFEESYGVKLAPIGEDGDVLIVLGDGDPGTVRRAIAATNRHVRKIWNYRIKRVDLRPLHGTFATAPDDPEVGWRVDYHDEPVPGSTPILVINPEVW